MEDFPTRITELLESVATKVRSMTVDRLAGAARWTAAGLVLIVLGMLLVVFLVVGLVRILGGLIGVEWTYVLIGGLFLVLGLFLWGKRKPKTEKA